MVVMFSPFVALAQVPDWNTPTKAKTTSIKKAAPKASVKKTTTKPKKEIPDFVSPNNAPNSNLEEEEVPASTKVFTAKPSTADVSVDQGRELVAVDLALASEIRDIGPLEAYSKHLSKDGILYDAEGGTPVGQNSAEVRFKAFPAGITLVRIPEQAMAYSGGGSSWGQYKVYRGSILVSSGRYLASWRKEKGVWKLVAELAAGKDAPPAVVPIKPNTPTKVSNEANGAKNSEKEKGTGLFDALGRVIKK